MKTGYQFPKLWEGARTTRLTFLAVNHTVAKRLLEKGVMWEGTRRTLQMIDMNKMGEFQHFPPP